MHGGIAIRARRQRVQFSPNLKIGAAEFFGQRQGVIWAEFNVKTLISDFILNLRQNGEIKRGWEVGNENLFFTVCRQKCVTFSHFREVLQDHDAGNSC